MCDLYDDLRRDAVELFTLMKVVRVKEAQLKALREGRDPQQGTCLLACVRALVLESTHTHTPTNLLTYTPT